MKKKGISSMTPTEPLNAALSSRSEDSKNFKKLVMDQVRAGGGTQAMDTKQLFQTLVKDTLEAFLELEMEEHLGYPKHDPEGRGSGNSRNGPRAKQYAATSARWRLKVHATATAASSRRLLPSVRLRWAISVKPSSRFTPVE
jgi:hypothetical protein